MPASVKTEVQSLERTPNGVEVVVSVDSHPMVPDAFQEIRARATALLSTGFATSGGEILEDIELGEVERFTSVTNTKITKERKFTEEKEITVLVDAPL